LIFVREPSDRLTSLVKSIDQQLATVAGKSARPLGVYILFDGKPEYLEAQLIAMAEIEGLHHVSLCIGKAPDDYEIARDADMTVVVYQPNRRREQKVTGNFALRTGELTDDKAVDILRAFTAVLPK
jgi:hypothetical protein